MLAKMPPAKIQIRCSLGRNLARGGEEIVVGAYRLVPIPTTHGGDQEAILEFMDAGGKTHSHPEGEGELLIAFLSLLLDCEVRKSGMMIRGVDVGVDQFGSTDLITGTKEPVEVLDYSDKISQLLMLSDQFAKQFVRASKSYSLALRASTIDMTLAFLLLTTTIECLSSQEEFIPHAELDKTKKSTERFCRLIKTYCITPERHYDSDGEEGFTHHLKTIYYVHRSAFVHSGKEVSIAAAAADKIGLPSLLHYDDDGKEVRTPGLAWFFRVVRDTLVGFLANVPKAHASPRSDILAGIAQRSAVLTMKVANRKPDA